MKSIRVTEETRDRLIALKEDGDNYEDVIRGLLDLSDAIPEGSIIDPDPMQYRPDRGYAITCDSEIEEEK